MARRKKVRMILGAALFGAGLFAAYKLGEQQAKNKALKP